LHQSLSLDRSLTFNFRIDVLENLRELERVEEVADLDETTEWLFNLSMQGVEGEDC